MLRIAVVDDDRDLQELFSAILAERNWAALACTDGATACEVLKAEQPDVIILDLWLQAPQTGWDILRELKADPATRSIPVILCSAATHFRRKEDWLARWRVAALAKPFDIDEVYQTVESVLKQGMANPGAGAPTEAGNRDLLGFA